MLSKKLTQYSLAAVAVMAAQKEVEAQIVYQDLDPDLYVPSGSEVFLDVDGDGNNDLGFFHYWYLGGTPGTAGYSAGFSVYGYDAGNGVMFSVQDGTETCSGGYDGDQYIVQQLEFGDLISADADFASGNTWLYGLVYEEFCGWFYNYGWTGTGYIGIKLNISGEIHYGWLELDGSTVTRLAYNAIPNMPITAGDTTFCELPAVTGSIMLPDGFKLFFQDADGDNNYRVKYRPAGTAEPFMVASNNSNHVTISGLDCNTTYEYAYKVACGWEGEGIAKSGWSPLQVITTDDCRFSSLFITPSMVIYPNPASDIFTFGDGYEEDAQLVLLVDQLGQVVKQLPVKPGVQCYIGDVPNGMYWVIVRREYGESRSMLVIQR